VGFFLGDWPADIPAVGGEDRVGPESAGRQSVGEESGLEWIPDGTLLTWRW
jgi:hypothetical protein